MFPSIPTDPTRGKSPIQQKTRTLRDFSKTEKLLTKIFHQPLNVSTFSPISRIFLHKNSTDTAPKHFKVRAMAEKTSRFTFDEHQEMGTQHLYLSSDDCEIASPCSSSIAQLTNNVPDTYSAITQLIAA